MSHAPGSTRKALVKLPRDPTACWEWLGTCNADGTATKSVNGEMTPARRWIWSMLFGPIPAGMVVTMACGKGSCINPYHLRCCWQCDANRAGTQATLLPDDVRDIRAKGKQRTPKLAEQLAERYGVTAGHIRKIWGRRTWRKSRPNHGPRKQKESQA